MNNNDLSQNGDNLPVAPFGDVHGSTLTAVMVSHGIKDFNDVASQLVELLTKNGKKSDRGRARKTSDGTPEFVEGSAAKPAVFEPDKIATDMRLWWEDGSGDKFILEQGTNGLTTWSTWNSAWIVKLLRSKYVRLKVRENETLGEIDQVLLHVMQERRLDLSLEALPGYKQGIHEYNGKRILVRTSPRLIEPKKGEWPIVKQLIDGRLNLEPEGGADQTPFFHGWNKASLESLLAGPGNFRPGQCCIFAGPRDCGKSRLQHQVITGLFGGRSADPGPYLFGRTDFNGEWLEGEHLLMEDPASSTFTKDRVMFGEKLKQIVVNDTQRLHPKRETAQMLQPFFRLTISVNDDPDKLRVLPLLTPDMKDKVQLFKVVAAPMPMSTMTLPERAAFRETVAAELPAYAWWLLNEFTVPAEMQGERFGVKSWLHPALEHELFEDTPAAELLRIIDAAKWDGRYLWDLESASQKSPGVWLNGSHHLEDLLLNSSMTKEAERLLKHNKLDRLLGRLKEDEPDRVVKTRTNQERRWAISRPVT